MEKVVTKIDPLTGKEFTYIISDKLNRKDGKVDAPKKFAEVSELLKRTKDTLPFNVNKAKK